MNKLLIILTLLLSGCIMRGPELKPHQKLFHKVKEIDGLSIYMKHDVNAIEKMLLFQSIIAQRIMWEMSNEQKVKPIDIYIFRARSIPCGERKGRFSGAFFLKDEDIHVTMGSRYSIPSLYHEFCHHYLHRTPLNADTEHKDKRWKGWKQEQEAMRRQIRKARTGLSLSKIYWSKE